MKKVYAVNSGCYSDYSVDALFSTKEKAEEYMAAFPRTGYDGYNGIEIFDLDPDYADRVRSGFKLWVVHMLRDGTIEKTESSEFDPSYHDVRAWVWRRSAAPAFAGKNIADVLQSEVLAKSEKHAIKVTNERRTQMIANGEWD